MIVATINQAYNESMDITTQLNQFFIAHEKKAYTIAYMALKNQDDALDVIQDVMIKFVEKYKYKNHEIWMPLFYRMIQNRITDFHRKKTRKNKFFSFFSSEEENELENIADETVVSMVKQIDNTFQMESLQLVIKQLPTRQLQAFICRIGEGQSVAETAKSMKCSQGSVKTHLFRALKHIRLELKDNG